DFAQPLDNAKPPCIGKFTLCNQHIQFKISPNAYISRSMNVRRKRTSARDLGYFNKYWETLSQGIRNILTGTWEVISYEAIYRDCYRLILGEYGDKLYSSIRELIVQHLEKVASLKIVPALPISEANSSQTNFANMIFLKILKNVWERHKANMLSLRDVVMYMDYLYANAANVPLIYELGLELFRDIIVKSTKYPIQTHLLNTFLYQIFLEREKEIIDRSIMKAITEMLLELTDENTKDSVYNIDFERLFLEKSSEYYRIEGHLLNVLNEEQERVEYYLSQTKGPKIRCIVKEELILKQLKTVIE
ncbi:1941_t:CDS:2, partial [Dentiscutata heterogama]